MPRLLIDNSQIGNYSTGNFSYSGMRPEHLGGIEYTLVTIVTDRSGSVSPFANELKDCVVKAVEACKSSPRAENLLIRYVTFGKTNKEEHGFVRLKDIDINSYVAPNCSGRDSDGTALYDAMLSAIMSANQYGRDLYKTIDAGANAITFVITDGADNQSTSTPAGIKKELEKIAKAEELESHMTVLVSINNDSLGTYMQKLATQAGLTQVVDAGNADAKNLAKLASFISRSVSSQSQSLGSGGPSQTLTI